MFFYQASDDVAVLGDCADRVFVIVTHQLAVTLDVSTEDCS
jgi:hypothetical protein